MKTGKVWLVGAGPGDAGLLTLKAKRLIDEADVVVYDRLVGEAVIAMIPEKAKVVDVGKKAGSHPIPQEEINRILVSEAQNGNRTVRLKGGDPFVFGRGGEELEALLAAGIACEVVPGVTSAIAAPAYAGIPVTHRGVSAGLHIYTAHARAGQESPLDYSAMAAQNGTLVFLMGGELIGEICAGLTAAGMSPHRACAVVERGTLARQRCVTGDLSTMVRVAADACIGSPSLMVVGEVVRLRETLDWRRHLPLDGKRIAVTRPAEKAGKLSELLRAEGAEVLELPCIRTQALDRKLPELSGYDWVAFSSPAGVEHFFETLTAQGRDIRELEDAKIAAVGPATAQALRCRGIRVDFIPEIFSAAALKERLTGNILFLEPLEPAEPMPGTVVPVYETLACSSGVETDDIDYLAFASASAVKSFRARYPRVRARAACIGQSTQKAAAEAGFDTIVARDATLAGIVEAIKEDIWT